MILEILAACAYLNDFLHGVALCMPVQYRIFPPLAAMIAARRRDMLATRRCRRSKGFLPICPATLGGAHQESGAGCPYW